MDRKVGSLALISVLLLTGCSTPLKEGDTYENKEHVERAPPSPSSNLDKVLDNMSESELELRWCTGVAEEGANIMFLSKEGVKDYVIEIYSGEFGNPPSDESLNTALENVKADYKSNCVSTGEMYKEDGNLDKDEVKAKLEKDKFTDAEINFAIGKLFK